MSSLDGPAYFHSEFQRGCSPLSLTPVTHHLVFSSSDVLTLNRVFFSEKWARIVKKGLNYFPLFLIKIHLLFWCQFSVEKATLNTSCPIHSWSEKWVLNWRTVNCQAFAPKCRDDTCISHFFSLKQRLCPLSRPAILLGLCCIGNEWEVLPCHPVWLPGWLEYSKWLSFVTFLQPWFTLHTKTVMASPY